MLRAEKLSGVKLQNRVSAPIGDRYNGFRDTIDKWNRDWLETKARWEGKSVEKMLEDDAYNRLSGQTAAAEQALSGPELVKFRNSIRNIVNIAYDKKINLSPVERIALFTTIADSIGGSGRYSGPHGSFAATSYGSEGLDKALGDLLSKYTSETAKNGYLVRLYHDAILGYIAAQSADNEYRRQLTDFITTMATSPLAALDMVNLGRGIYSMSRGFAARMASRGARDAGSGLEATAGRLTGNPSALMHGIEESITDDVSSRFLTCNSFTPSTPVRTLTGLVAIGALTVGTPVLAFNEQTQQNGYYPITDVITHGLKAQGVTYLTLQDGKSGQPEAITTTPEHPFYVQAPADSQVRPKPVGHEELNSHWVGAGHLQIGDKIKEADDTVGTVANVVTVQQTMQMFNLTVDTAHTFYVGEQGWLVHNANQPRTPGGAFTQPTLPSGTIVKSGEVSIVQYYAGTDHGPAHFHVTGGGRTTRIGMNGYPLAGDPPLTLTQQKVVDKNAQLIRNAGKKIGRYLAFQEMLNKPCE